MNAPQHPSIELHPVKSSQIHSIGYDLATQTLAICFTRKGGAGTVYHYADVSSDQFEAFKNAESIGKHFGAHIKGNPKHPHTKIVGE